MHHRNKFSTRLHSSGMHTTRSLTVSPSMLCSEGGGVYLPGPGGASQHALRQIPTPPPCEQNSWHMLLKILPCPKTSFAGGKKTDLDRDCHPSASNHKRRVTRTDISSRSFMYEIFIHGYVNANILFVCHMINSTDEQMRNFEKIMLVMKYFFLSLNRYQPETDVSLSAVQVWETKENRTLTVFRLLSCEVL